MCTIAVLTVSCRRPHLISQLLVEGSTHPPTHHRASGYPDDQHDHHDDARPRAAAGRGPGGRHRRRERGPSGALASADVVWDDALTVTFKNVKLQDAACDGNSVYFTVRFNRRSPDAKDSRRENKSGCKTTVTFPNFAHKASGVPQNVALYVCVNRSFKSDICAYTASSDNPYVA